MESRRARRDTVRFMEAQQSLLQNHSEAPGNSARGRARQQQTPQQDTPLQQLPPQLQAPELIRGVDQLQLGQCGSGDASGVDGRGGIKKRSIDSMIASASAKCLTGNIAKQGTFGAEVKLLANYFEVTKPTKWLLYQYHVDFSPEEDRTALKKGLMKTQADIIGVYVFDGTVLYTQRKLPEPFEANVMDRNNTPYVIKARLVNELPYGDPAYMQVYCIVLRKCLSFLNGPHDPEVLEQLLPLKN